MSNSAGSSFRSRSSGFIHFIPLIILSAAIMGLVLLISMVQNVEKKTVESPEAATAGQCSCEIDNRLQDNCTGVGDECVSCIPGTGNNGCEVGRTACTARGICLSDGRGGLTCSESCSAAPPVGERIIGRVWYNGVAQTGYSIIAGGGGVGWSTNPEPYYYTNVRWAAGTQVAVTLNPGTGKTCSTWNLASPDVPSLNKTGTGCTAGITIAHANTQNSPDWQNHLHFYVVNAVTISPTRPVASPTPTQPPVTYGCVAGACVANGGGLELDRCQDECAAPTPTPISACTKGTDDWVAHVWQPTNPTFTRTTAVDPDTTQVVVKGYWGWSGLATSPVQTNEKHYVELIANPGAVNLGAYEVVCDDFGNFSPSVDGYDKRSLFGGRDLRDPTDPYDGAGDWQLCATKTIPWNKSWTSLTSRVDFAGDTSSPGSHRSRVIVGWCGASLPVPTPGLVATPTPTPSGSNLILNSGFESGKTSWNSYSDGSMTFDAGEYDSIHSSKEARLTINTAGSNVQLYQYNTFSLEAGKRYKVTFDAKSSLGQDLEVGVHKQSSYVNYMGSVSNTSQGNTSTKFNVTTSWKSFELEFTATGFSGTTSDVRFRFWLAPYDDNKGVYYIDNVTLRKY